MIFNQLFDEKSSTYTYIISSGEGREALIIDPVIEHTEEYLKILENLKLLAALEAWDLLLQRMLDPALSLY